MTEFRPVHRRTETLTPVVSGPVPASSPGMQGWHVNSLAARALSRVSDAVIGVCRDGRIRYLNVAAEKMLATTTDSAANISLTALLEFGPGVDVNALVADCIANAQSRSKTVTVTPHLKPDVELDVRVTVAPAATGLSDSEGAIIVLSDTSELRRLNARLKYEARHDPLTLLFNRRELIARVERLLSMRNHIEAQHTLLYLDLDRFKVVNDSCGHSAGDLLLRQIAECLLDQVRENDTVARIGGDEFVILLERCSLSRGEEVAKAVLTAVGDMNFEFNERSFRIGVSIGVVPISRGYDSFDELIADADDACYQAKRQGRHSVVVHRTGREFKPGSASDDSADISTMDFLEREAFSLYYQDIVDASQPEKVVGREILLRLKGVAGDIDIPDRFLAGARRLDAMAQVDRWVVNRTLEYFRHNSRALDDIQFVSINVAPTTLQRDSFVECVEIALRKSRVPADMIYFEITEHAPVEDIAALQQRMFRLVDLGCSFAIDDFGAGMHRFDCLRDLPVEIVKVDGSIAQRMCEDLVDRTIAKSINDISHLLGKRTVLEHIENEVILAEATTLGFDYCQGRYLHKEKPLY